MKANLASTWADSYINKDSYKKDRRVSDVEFKATADRSNHALFVIHGDRGENKDLYGVEWYGIKWKLVIDDTPKELLWLKIMDYLIVYCLQEQIANSINNLRRFSSTQEYSRTLAMEYVSRMRNRDPLSEEQKEAAKRKEEDDDRKDKTVSSLNGTGYKGYQQNTINHLDMIYTYMGITPSFFQNTLMRN